ncbi:hypothetical protein B6D60_06725 [candidate division KSB1 bacterium 4484_87]|nr:MAG: hypothetical protein B6D60_06725 [candidate division KSB1 bacterium 4484_87]
MFSGIIYSIAEGLRGLRRARFSTTVSVFTIFLSLIIIAFFLIVIFNVRFIVLQIQSRMELEAFIDASFSEEQIEILKSQIEDLQGIEQVNYISKEKAAEIFREQVGHDIFEILDENPLPASFQIRLKPEYRSAALAKQVFENILSLDGIDEIIYRHDLLVLLEKYMHIFMLIIASLGGLLALSSIILVSNTIKLVIFSRRKIIEIMKLVGATRGFIRRPYIVEGIFQGFFGGGLAALFVYFVLKIVNIEIPDLILIDQRIYWVLVLLGIIFGFMGSIIALRKFLRY